MLENSETTRRGLVLPDLFVHVLEENSVFLPKKSLRTLISHFQALNGGVQVAKFLKWVELSRPADHVDPELMFARLPQPYHRIVKILERDILDVSWELIKQQSARFKAEATAALAATARSTRPGALKADQATADPDDYEAAKKRCCKSFVRTDFGGDATSVSCITQHSSLPLTLVAFQERMEAVDELTRSDRIVLRLLNSLSQEVMTEFTLPPGQPEDPLTPQEPAGPQTTYQVTHLTPLRLCRVANDGNAATCVFGVQLNKLTTTPATEDQPESTSRLASVFIYQLSGVLILNHHSVGISAAGQASSFQLVATGKFESLEWVELAPDGQHLALSTSATGNISVFKIPIVDTVVLTDSNEPPSVLDLITVPPLMKIDNPVTHHPVRSDGSPQTHFLIKPSSIAPLSHASAQTLEAYAIVVCHDTKVLKYTLHTAGTNSATQRASWSHLAAITSSHVDSTTQFLVVGLADGSVVVWNTLDEIDHVFLTPSVLNSSPPGFVKSDPRVDVVTTYRDEYIVAFSAASQQIRFFDVRNRINPQLLRIVTAPSASSQKDGVRVVALVETTSFLDIPIAIVGYSNGFLVMYDMRNAEAIGSFRYRPPLESSLRSLSSEMQASQHGVSVTQASSLDFYDWHQLLLASFSSFDHLLQQRNLVQVRLNVVVA